MILFYFSQRGSLLNVLVKRFESCMPEKWLLYVLNRVLSSLDEFKAINRGYPPSFSTTSIYMNWGGTIRISTPSSKVIYFGGVPDVNENLTPVINPFDIGNMTPSEIVATKSIAEEGINH